jgi:hypothetical protein
VIRRIYQNVSSVSINSGKLFCQNNVWPKLRILELKGNVGEYPIKRNCRADDKLGESVQMPDNCLSKYTNCVGCHFGEAVRLTDHITQVYSL